MEKFIEKFPAIDQSQLLSDDDLNSIEGGACKESCKQACQPGNMNGSVGETTKDKVIDAATEVAKAAVS